MSNKQDKIFNLIKPTKCKLGHLLLFSITKLANTYKALSYNVAGSVDWCNFSRRPFGNVQ